MLALGSLLAILSKWIEPHAVTREPQLACDDPDHAERHAKHWYGSVLELNFIPFGQEPEIVHNGVIQILASITAAGFYPESCSAAAQ